MKPVKNRAVKYTIGVDYGTNSCRALLVRTTDGAEVATAVFPYPTGEAGIILDPKDPNVARQNPADYIDGFVATVAAVVAEATKKIKTFNSSDVAGIGIDTTGSTPMPVNAEGLPLAMTPEFRRHPAAQAWLWKDHTGWEEAAIITETARKAKVPYLAKCGGTYSSEWFWSKIWHCQRSAPEVFDAAYSWIELCDFVPAWITGNLKPDQAARSVCAAGHKAMFSTEWGGLPSKAFLKKLSPKLADLRDRLYSTAQASDQIAGYLTAETAAKVGLAAGIPVAVGAFDAHHGAVGAGIKPGRLVKIIGTSTCDILVAPATTAVADIPGVCGIVPGSVVPGMTGLEAGQSAVGDIFLWFAHHCCPPEFRRENEGATIAALEKAAAKLAPGASGLMALDWNNGNRTVLVDPLLSGLMLGQTLHTTAPEMLRALVEATAFGAATIINRFEEYGVAVREVVNCGGIAEKSPFLMQIYADVCNRPMRLSRSAQTCALGAAIFGSVAGGVYRTTAAAQRAMTGIKETVYKPIKENVKIYAELFAIYRDLHDAFGATGRHPNLEGVMKQLIAIRQRVR
ncbi:MAG: ribulokinase [Lentisphaerae bacterium]|jgi:L-ribulokinase|nr:ribulokinase [Lentisphaerota bacterium]